MVVSGENEIFSSELVGNGGSLESDFVEIIFVFGDSEVGIEGFNLVECPSIV